MAELLLKEEVYAIIGAAIEVHSVLGCGFLEPVYQEALEIELANRNIPFVAQKELPVCYKGLILKKAYLADFFSFWTGNCRIKSTRTIINSRRSSTAKLSQSYWSRSRIINQFWC